MYAYQETVGSERERLEERLRVEETVWKRDWEWKREGGRRGWK